MVEYTIENFIVTTNIKANLNLKSIALSIENVDYNPENFPGIVFKLDDPKTATFILKNGKTVCIGSKSFKESRIALDTVTQKLAEAGVEIENEIDIDIQNIIVSLNLGSRVNLNEIGKILNRQQVSYKPEDFPGLVYQTDLDNVTILAFDSGKIVCYGATKLSEVQKVLDKFINRLHSVGLI